MNQFCVDIFREFLSLKLSLSVLWSEISFYGNASVEQYNAICDHKTEYLHPQMTFFNTDSHFDAYLLVFPLKLHYFTPTASTASDVKPDVSQRKATLRNDVGFPTVYCRIYCRKFLTSSSQTSRYIHSCIRMLCISCNLPYVTIPNLSAVKQTII